MGKESTRRAIVKLLKTQGAMHSAALAKRLRLTPMAVRQHLYALQREQLVASDERPVPVGRPVKHWRLTRQADALFPDAYAELNVALIEAEGFHKAKDLLAFHIDLAGIPMDRLTRIGRKVKERHPNLSFRPVRKKTLKQDIGKIKEVYNAAWEDNWGFVPMTDAEVDFMAERLKPLLMEGLIWLAEAGSETVGFLLALPDYNMALKPLQGHLLTPRLFGFIPYLLGWKRPTRTRVLTLGVKEKYRSKGLESALLIEGLRVGFEAGVRESEASWILEDNVMMRRVLGAIGGRPYKTYRIYEREV